MEGRRHEDRGGDKNDERRDVYENVCEHMIGLIELECLSVG